MPALRLRLFDDQEVVTAGMRFDERNHYRSIVPQRSITVTQITTLVEREPRDRIDRCERTAGQ
jgi:hypothetical protein